MKSKVWAAVGYLSVMSLVLAACASPTPVVERVEVEREVTRIVAGTSACCAERTPRNIQQK